MKKLTILTLLAIGSGFFPGCERVAPPGQREAGAAFHAVATTGMVADIVRQVAGEHVQVTGIIGSGVDPHLYTPSRMDVLHFREADIIFYNGLLLEGRLSDVILRLERQGIPALAVAEAALQQHTGAGEGPAASGVEHDPHVWMDPQLWSKAVRAVADALAAFDPERAAEYETRAQAYMARLAALDAYAREALKPVPEAHRVLVTAHDAFGYFGGAYEFEVRGIQGLSTESEAGIQDLERLVAYVVDHGIPAVFVETSVADKNVRALIEGARARGHTLRLGGTLFSDAMGPAGSYEGSYLGMIDHNVTTIARALGGEAPAGGWQDRLRQAAKKDKVEP